ncbi:MAG: Xaa-Pro peptidase family protein [Clostridiales bacterium]|jgi:Xaa-Pro aminopeptidase|nr:Xaa-Pro peptidase family protein [Clostridiales bacterium]
MTQQPPDRNSKARLAIPQSEYAERLRKVQEAMEEARLDVLVTHACECESANVRYLSNFWAVFDFAGVIVPRKGDAVLLTGGPESYEFARQFSRIADVRVHPLYVETSAPVWDKPTDPVDFAALLGEWRARFPIARIGVANSNILPAAIEADLREGAKGAELVPADGLMMKLRLIKSAGEIALLKEAYRITQAACAKAVEAVRPGAAEWEIEAAWRAEAYRLGAEGTSYPIWVTSGPNTYQSLCRSTDRQIGENDMVQLTFGAKYNGYCGNICRPVALGKIPDRHAQMRDIALEALHEAIADIRPGAPFALAYDHFHRRLSDNGFANLALYGPAHGTGMQECEGPWVDNRTDAVFRENMVLNVDIWIADGEFGVRYEDGLAVGPNGSERLTRPPDGHISL